MINTILDILFNPAFWIPLILSKTVLKYLFRLDLEVAAGTLVYGFFLVFVRMGRSAGDSFAAWLFSRKQLRMATTVVPTSVLDYNHVYRLSGLQVVLGLDRSRRPVKTDLEEGHTLLAAITGAGKTVMLHGILAQIVGRPEVRDRYEIHLFDLKGDHRSDFLNRWSPIIDGYYTIDEEGSTKSAIEAMGDIIYRIRHSEKRFLVIVDEVARLTDMAPDRNLRSAGEAMLRQLSAQLRSRGTLVFATQRPHFQTMARNISGNLERKICMAVDDIGTAQMILRTNYKPKVDPTQFLKGEFIMKIGRVERVGRTLDVELPGMIDQVVMNALGSDADKDVRLRAFCIAIEGLDVGMRVRGMNKVKDMIEEVNNELLKVYYRNYADSGAIEPSFKTDGSVAHYVLVKPFKEAYGTIKSYIASGKWQEAPPPITNGGRE